MTDLTSFTLFPHLPTELRLKIWDIINNTPRIVNITCKKAVKEEPRASTQRYVSAFLSSTPPPLTLHINHESRSETLAQEGYAPYFRTLTSPNYIYLNLSLDTIRCSDALLTHIPKNELRGIRSLELEVVDAAYFGHFNMEILKQMKELRKLVLETHQSPLLSWTSDQGHLTREIEAERRNDLGWESPDVSITEKGTQRVLVFIAGGALVPGWREGDPYPDDVPGMPQY